MRDLRHVPTAEMNANEWKSFRKRWIDNEADMYHHEAEMTWVESYRAAEHAFEECVGQEGFTGRDLRIYEERAAKQQEAAASQGAKDE